MRKGLTSSIDSIIEIVSSMESIKTYTLCGGTALAMQLGHRKSEDLDVMMWRKSKNDKDLILAFPGNKLFGLKLHLIFKGLFLLTAIMINICTKNYKNTKKTLFLLQKKRYG